MGIIQQQILFRTLTYPFRTLQMYFRTFTYPFRTLQMHFRTFTDPFRTLAPPFRTLTDPLPHPYRPLPHLTDALPHPYTPIPHLYIPLPHLCIPLPHPYTPLPHLYKAFRTGFAGIFSSTCIPLRNILIILAKHLSFVLSYGYVHKRFDTSSTVFHHSKTSSAHKNIPRQQLV